jgi:hypothetical protein
MENRDYTQWRIVNIPIATTTPLAASNVLGLPLAQSNVPSPTLRLPHVSDPRVISFQGSHIIAGGFLCQSIRVQA